MKIDQENQTPVPVSWQLTIDAILTAIEPEALFLCLYSVGAPGAFGGLPPSPPA
jgi:hypothetical protein